METLLLTHSIIALVSYPLVRLSTCRYRNICIPTWSLNGLSAHLIWPLAFNCAAVIVHSINASSKTYLNGGHAYHATMPTNGLRAFQLGLFGPDKLLDVEGTVDQFTRIVAQAG